MTQDYLGTKQVTAWVQQKDGADGYAVKYSDGYTSWSPKAIFEEAYRPVTGLSFGLAVEALKMGKRVARSGWNGKGMWLVLDPGSVVSEVREGSAYHKAGVTGSFTINPHIDMKTATGEMQPGWLASQTDMLADDWMIV
jgi:hypothetical protein